MKSTAPPITVNQLNYGATYILVTGYFPKTRMFRLSDGEEIMMLGLFVLIQYPSVTDGQKDRHLCSSNTSACIACYATTLVIKTVHVNTVIKWVTYKRI